MHGAATRISLQLFSVELKTNLANAETSTGLQFLHVVSLRHRSDKITTLTNKLGVCCGVFICFMNCHQLYFERTKYRMKTPTIEIKSIIHFLNNKTCGKKCCVNSFERIIFFCK